MTTTITTTEREIETTTAKKNLAHYLVLPLPIALQWEERISSEFQIQVRY